MLIAHNITKQFSGVLALDAVSAAINPGRVTVVIGPSGSGKTTLIRCLSLLDPPNSGKITIDQQVFDYPESGRFPRRSPWPRVTVVFQQLFLWPHLTLSQNILLPLQVKGMPTTGFDEMVELFQMREFVDRYPNEVSLGQRQRAALARAAILNPEYILLDEITSALDIEQTGIILHYLLSLRDRGIGLLVVTHLIGFARRLLARREGDEMLFLEKGRVAASGGIDLLIRPDHPRLREFLAATDYSG